MPPNKNSGKGRKSNGTGNANGNGRSGKETKTPKGKKALKKESKQKRSSSGAGIGVRHFIIAFVALIAGILTPPFLRYFNVNVSSRSLMSAILMKNDSGNGNGNEAKSGNIGDGGLDAIAPVRQTKTQNKQDAKMNAELEEDSTAEEEGELESESEEEEEEIDILHVKCTGDNLEMFLHEKPVEGMHVLCFEERHGAQILKVWDGASKSKEDDEYQLKGPNDTEYWMDVVELIGTELVKPHHVTNTQPWALFSTNGERIAGEADEMDDFDMAYTFEDLTYHGMVILMDGGQWIWPGVRNGFKRRIEIDTGYPASEDTPQERTAEIETLSLQPLVLSVRNFISDEECTHVQNVAEPFMEYSEVTLMDHDQGRESSDFRTSQSTFVWAKDEIMHALEVRTASLTRVPKNHQEHTQVLRYGKNEKYSGHVDWFDPTLYQADPGTLNLIQNGKRNRLATVFWYLSDVEGGGETNFPRSNGAPQPYDLDKCYQGLMVKPERGKVIVFYSLTPDGKGDEYSLHAACPVKDGIKWAANKWVWNAPMGYVSDAMTFSSSS